MKRTPFTSIHEESGAKMVEFAGYYMPVQYEGLTAEHEAVRNDVGVFDVSHMGEIWVRGSEAFGLVQRITTNDVAKLTPGKIQYSCMPNGKGGIVDDLLVYMMSEDEYLLVVNASNIEKDWEWIVSQNLRGAELENASDLTGQLAVQGPKAAGVIQKLTATDVSSIPYYTFKYVTLAGIENVLLSNTGYTGAGGFEIYFEGTAGPALWKAIFEAGEAFGIKPAGLGARDTLRLEMGFCLYGNDINDSTSPIEAGLGWITKFVEGNDFIDRPFLEEQKEKGPDKRLRGFEMIDKGIPRQHYEICDQHGNVIGEVTSGTMSPTLKKAIGMGYVKAEHAGFDSELYIRIRNKLVKARITRLPFLEKK